MAPDANLAGDERGGRDARFSGVGNSTPDTAIAALKGGAGARESLPAPAQDEYYWADLVGLDVVNAERESLGRVTELFSNGAHDVMRVGTGKGERLVPFVPAVVRKVDLAAREDLRKSK